MFKKIIEYLRRTAAEQADLRAKGICFMCGEVPAMPNDEYCFECYMDKSAAP